MLSTPANGRAEFFLPQKTFTVLGALYTLS